LVFFFFFGLEFIVGFQLGFLLLRIEEVKAFFQAQSSDGKEDAGDTVRIGGK